MTYRLDLQKKDVLILFSALLLSFSYATSPFSFFIYFAFIPFIQRLEISKTLKESIKIGYIVGLIVNAFVFYWIIYYKFDNYLFIVLLNPIQFAVFAYIYSFLKVFSHQLRLLIFPFLWTFLEYLREFGDLALNWLNIGYSQGNYLSIIQFADISGMNGVVFWICVINVVLYNLIFKVKKFKYSSIDYILLILLFVLPFIYGQFSLNEEKVKKSIYASYIQPNINSKYKWDKNQIENNTNILIEESNLSRLTPHSLLVWPETAIPVSFQQLGHYQDTLIQFSGEKNISLLTGIIFNNNENIKFSKYNSTILFVPNQSYFQTYHKIYLVPIAESLPYHELYDFIIPDTIRKDFYSDGTSETIFTVHLESIDVQFNQQSWGIVEDKGAITPINFSTIICFESSFPSFVRTFVNNGAELIVVITNDEWFGYSTQSVQHLITSRFRAIENRKSIIHCSNSGISSFIDFKGRFYGTSDLLQKYSSTQLVPLNEELTLFGRFGDWISKLSTIFILITFVLIFYKHKKITK